MSDGEVCRVCKENLTDEMFGALLDRYYQRGADDVRASIVKMLATNVPVTDPADNILLLHLCALIERKEDGGP